MQKDYYNGDEVMRFISKHGLNFALGNVVKYVSRAGVKNPETHIEDLEKALDYLTWEIARLKENKSHEDYYSMKEDLIKHIRQSLYGGLHDADSEDSYCGGSDSEEEKDPEYGSLPYTHSISFDYPWKYEPKV